MTTLAKALGGYFFQLLVQGLVLGVLAYAAIFLPTPFNLVFAVTCLFILWRLPKNPRHFWKRMFTTWMGGMLVGGGLNIAADLNITLPPWLHAEVLARYTPGIPSWVLFGIAGIIAIIDLGNEFLHLRTAFADGDLWGSNREGRARITDIPTTGGFAGTGKVLVGLKEGTGILTLTQVGLRLKSAVWWISPKELEVEVSTPPGIIWQQGVQNAPQLHPNHAIWVNFSFEIERGWRSHLLFWWRTGWCIPQRRGALDLQFSQKRNITVEITFDPVKPNQNTG